MPRLTPTCPLPVTRSTATTVPTFPCEILMPLSPRASCTVTCPDDFKSGEFLEMIRLAFTLICRKPQ